MKQVQGHCLQSLPPSCHEATLPKAVTTGTNLSAIPKLIYIPRSTGPWSGRCPADVGDPSFPTGEGGWEADEGPSA